MILYYMGGFFIFVFLLFIVAAVFLPEWVGITGKKAHEIMEQQRAKDAEAGPDGGPEGGAGRG